MNVIEKIIFLLGSNNDVSNGSEKTFRYAPYQMVTQNTLRRHVKWKMQLFLSFFYIARIPKSVHKNKASHLRVIYYNEVSICMLNFAYISSNP